MGKVAVLANGWLSRLSHVVTRLERRGWVRREVCPENGRCTNAILTGAGRDKLVAAAPGRVATVRYLILDALRATQVRAVRDIGRRVLRRIDPDEPCLEAPRARRRSTQLRVEVET
jgi:DNA-binding MarR family transcriptional regulator